LVNENHSSSKTARAAEIFDFFLDFFDEPTLTLPTHYPQLLELRLVQEQECPLRSRTQIFQQLGAWALRIRMIV
jgi:hypothetical protein